MSKWKDTSTATPPMTHKTVNGLRWIYESDPVQVILDGEAVTAKFRIDVIGDATRAFTEPKWVTADGAVHAHDAITKWMPMEDNDGD